jgi:PAS domain S-box-containing protein
VIEGRFMSASPVGQPSEEAMALFSAFERAVDAVVITGIDNQIRHFNAAAERMWGYHRDEVVGRQVSVLVPLDVREHLDGVIAAKSAMDPQDGGQGPPRVQDQPQGRERGLGRVLDLTRRLCRQDALHQLHPRRDGRCP